MLSRRTLTRPCIGLFQIPVWTVLPRHEMSCGRPTLTDTSRAIIAPPNICVTEKLGCSAGVSWLDSNWQKDVKRFERCAQGDDSGTFLGDFVAALSQIEFPAGCGSSLFVSPEGNCQEMANYCRQIGPSFRTPLLPVFQKMLLTRDAQGANFSKLWHGPNFGQERICFHLRAGAVVLFDSPAQLAEGEFWLTAERVHRSKLVFRTRVVIFHHY